MGQYVLSFQQVDRTKIMEVGGKGASLGELSKINGIRVPDGFCVTTEAYKKIMGNYREINILLDELSQFGKDDRRRINEISTKIRGVIECAIIPKNIIQEIESNLTRFGVNDAFAVRSSATAEDLPTASFAGQQDTYLNVYGKESILKHISKCWASLFTERAIAYRIQNGFDHRKVFMSVVVQKMVFPQVAGILFTADPVNSNRKVVSIDASFGLGEALVSGLVNADNYKVRNGEIIDKKVAAKKLAIYALKEGGTQQLAIEAGRQNNQALADDQILLLEEMGRKIEQHFDSPQDIEWCLDDDTFYIVQSRPITTLYPIPERNDQRNHVYISVGHNQMMTDPMKPLGLSLFRITAARRSFYIAGGRLFVDITDDLASPAKRDNFVNMLGRFDPLTHDALRNVLERENFLEPLADPNQDQEKGNKAAPPPNFNAMIDYDPEIVPRLIKTSQQSLEQLKQDIQAKSGTALIDFILEHNLQLKKNISDPQSFGVIMTGMNASSWINEKMMEWLGEKNVADTISQSVPNNITSEMGLALLDVADVIRPYPLIIEYLHDAKDDNFLDELEKFEGGKKVKNAILSFLDKYGMRCVGEIDITRTRWSEKPITLVPLILSNVRNFEPNASSKKFAQGLQEASKKEQEILEKLKQLPEGEQKVQETKRMIQLIRNYAGYREYPKYSIISHYFIYKQALLKEAQKMVEAGVIHEKEDIYYLSVDELREVIDTYKLDYQIINKRKEDYRLYDKLVPPRVITSDGEIITGKYKRENLPPGAIVGLPVSSGIIEGRARVILKMEEADLKEGDILITSFTDPSWTPLFVSIKGMVTEVGGLMTHGAVIAREYGLPAVVGVENATRFFKDGQRIRVNGTDGYIEIL